METRSTCPYCGVGCGVIIESDAKQITGVRGDPDHPANFGRLCTKGSTLHLTARPAHLQVRALHPELRTQRDTPRVRASWDDALNHLVDRFTQTLTQHGPDSVGFYISGQLLTEDYYVFNKLAKGLIGTNNVDTNSRLCMSSAVAGYKQSLGADAPPCSYEDIAHAQTIFIVGSNTAVAHPILFRRIEDAKRANPNLKIIFADPRKTETAEIADLTLQIQPGTDVALFHGMLHVMMWEDLIDPTYIMQYTLGYEEIKARVREYTPKMVSDICGVSEVDIVQAARWFGGSKATLSLYCQGLNQSTSGTAKNSALINLHLATGQIGKPGAGPFSLTGQPNAMGGREVGGLANLLSAHRDMSNAAHRAEVAKLWGIDDVPSKPGKTAVEMFEAAADGEIKALWIACTNPAQSMPDQATVRRALERCELVVLQECYANTATAKYADVILPATTWGEKDGTVTNSERRISRVLPAINAPGEAWHDWRIGVEFAQRLEAKLRPDAPSLFPYSKPEEIWNEHRESTRGRDLDITGLTYAKLEQAPEQWPFPEGATQGKARLYEDGKFPTTDGKARFIANAYKPVVEPRDARYPFALNTGRLRDQWHGMSRTGTIGKLFGHVSAPALQMHPQDMSRRKLVDGDLVHLTSRRGSQIVPVQASDEIAITQAYLPMHWGEEFLGGAKSHGVNSVTNSAYCAQSKQPELKHSAVKILRAELTWHFAAFAWLPEDDVLSRMTALRELMPQFDYSSCVPFSAQGNTREIADTHNGIAFIAGNYSRKEDGTLKSIEKILMLDEPSLMRYEDAKHGVSRVMRVQDGRLTGVLLAGDVQAQSWLKSLLQQRSPVAEFGRYLMMPSAKLPSHLASRVSDVGKQLCSCFGVSEAAVRACLAQSDGDVSQRLAAVQEALKCGTNCGSCVPEIKRLIRLQAAKPAPALA
jgi:assimilatory nitrate reductase catalytic subunit